MTSFIMILSFLAALAASDSYYKTICVCDKCNSDNKACKNMPSVNPYSTSFAEDFADARRNSRDIKVIFNDEERLNVTFDLNIIKGINAEFSTSEYMNLYLPYNNKADYSATNITISSLEITAFFYVKDGTTTSNEFKIGNLIFNEGTVKIYKDGSTLDLSYRTYKGKLAFLKNITSLTQHTKGVTNFILDRQSVQLRFMTAKTELAVDSVSIDYNFVKGSQLMITGQPISGGYCDSDELKIILSEGIKYSDLPLLNISSISNIKFEGTLWAPSDDSQLLYLKSICKLIVPAGDFPFIIESDYCNIYLSGATTIHGEVSGYPRDYCEFRVYYTGTQPCTLSLPKPISAKISIRTPLVDVSVEKLIEPSIGYSTDYFPIAFGFDFNRVSKVVVKDIEFSKSNYGYKRIFNFWSVVETMPSLNEINNYQGLRFLEIPENSIEILNFDFEFDINSPSEGINGFNAATPGVGLVYSTENSKLVFNTKITKSPYEFPYCICFGSGCKAPEGYTQAIYKNMQISEASKISQLIPHDVKLIYLGCKDYYNTINFDFSGMDGSEITIIGSDSRNSKITLANTKPVKYLKISDSKFNSGITFESTTLELRGCEFTDNEYTFKSTYLIFDLVSQKSLVSKYQGAKLNNLYLIADHSSANDASINIDKQYYTITVRSSSGYSYESAKVYHSSTTNLTIETRFSVTISNMGAPYYGAEIPGFTLKRINENSIKIGQDGWNDIPLTSNITIDHGKNRLFITYTYPNQGNKISFVGVGAVSTKVEYQNDRKWCFSTKSSNKCNNIATSDRAWSETALEEIAAVTDPKNTIYLEVENDEVTLFNFSWFDSKNIVLKSYPSSSNRKIKIIFDTNEIDRTYSKIEFIGVTLDTESQNILANIGEMELTNVVVSDAWKSQVSLNINRFTCLYKDLYKFNQITITDQLSVSGQQGNVEKDIIFINDADADDLEAQIEGEVDIVLDASSLKIGKINYKITQSENYDAFITMSDNSQVKVTCASKATKIPRITISALKTESSIKFEGTWPDIDPTDPTSLVKLQSMNKIDITLNGNIPLDLNILNDATIHINADTAISGPLVYKSNTVIKNPSFKLLSDNVVSFDIKKGVFIETYNDNKREFTLFEIQSPGVHVTIPSLTRSESLRYDCVVSFINTIGKESTSSVEINQIGGGIKLASHFFIISSLTGKITGPEADFPFFKRENPILKAPADNLVFDVNVSKQYVIDDSVSDRTHGFYVTMDCLGIELVPSSTTGYREVKLVKEIMPSDIPYTIDYTDQDSSTAELVIKKGETNKLNNLKSNLPDSIKDIIMRIHVDMTDTLDFAQSLSGFTGNVKMLIKSGSNVKRLAHTTVASISNPLDLTFLNVNLQVTGSTAFKATRLNFTDCDFTTPTFKLTGDTATLVTDADSLNNLLNANVLTSRNEDMVIHSANIIVFEADGWQFKERTGDTSHSIKKAAFPRLTFESRRSITLEIKEKIPKIMGLSLNAIPLDDGNVYVTFSRNWGNVEVEGDLKIATSTEPNKVYVTASSYPIPRIFDLPNDKIITNLETYDDGLFDVVTFKDGYVFDNENLLINMVELDITYQIVKGTNMVFKGDSSLKFTDDEGTLEVENIEFAENSKSSLSSLDVIKSMNLKSNAQVESIINFPKSSKATFHWSLDSTPRLNLSDTMKQLPSLEIVYDGSSIDKEAFKQKLIQEPGIVLIEGDFDCNSLARKTASYVSGYKFFNDGQDRVISLSCDTSSQGNVLLLYGLKEIVETDDSQGQGNKNGNKLNGGQTAGVVIACVVVVAVVVFAAVYITQRKKIDRLKNEIPAENTAAYRTNENTETDSNYNATDTSDDGL